MKLERSKEWWLDRARREGDSTPAAGMGATEMSAWWEVPGGHINVDALKRDASDLLASLKRLLGPNPGSDDRDAAWAAVEKAER